MHTVEIDVVRVSEAARLLKLSKSTVYELIANGQLESIRVGRAILIPRAAIVAFLERNTRGKR